jgi:hypothetical protein
LGLGRNNVKGEEVFAEYFLQTGEANEEVGFEGG